MSYDVDRVTVVVDGVELDFTKFDRYLLYCADEGRDPSLRLYDLGSISRRRGWMVAVDLMTADYRLTDKGKRTVKALRERPR